MQATITEIVPTGRSTKTRLYIAQFSASGTWYHIPSSADFITSTSEPREANSRYPKSWPHVERIPPFDPVRIRRHRMPDYGVIAGFELGSNWRNKNLAIFG